MNLKRRTLRNAFLNNTKAKKMLKTYRKKYKDPIGINDFMTLLTRSVDDKTVNA